MVRQKEHYNLISEQLVYVEQPCAKCGRTQAIEQCFIEYGRGWLPDDYEYVTKCVCEVELDNPACFALFGLLI